MTNALDLNQLHTVQLVPVTPFDEEGQVSQDQTVRLYQRLETAGIRVFIPCAGSAEFQTLTSTEILRVIQIARETLGEQATIVAPIGFQADFAVKLGNQAHQAGAAAAWGRVDVPSRRSAGAAPCAEAPPRRAAQARPTRR